MVRVETDLNGTPRMGVAAADKFRSAIGFRLRGPGVLIHSLPRRVMRVRRWHGGPIHHRRCRLGHRRGRLGSAQGRAGLAGDLAKAPWARHDHPQKGMKPQPSTTSGGFIASHRLQSNRRQRNFELCESVASNSWLPETGCRGFDGLIGHEPLEGSQDLRHHYPCFETPRLPLTPEQRFLHALFSRH